VNFSFIKPTAGLQPYIYSLWVFESYFGLPANDRSIIVPNGRARIVIPYKNSLTMISDSHPVTSKPDDVFVAGLWTIPTLINSSAQETGTIGIDLSPKGLYRFFNLNMEALANRIYTFDDLFGAWGKRLQSELSGIESIDEKVIFMQKVLMSVLERNTKDHSLLDYAIDSIIQSQGLIGIRSLASETGYSKRYLDMLFNKNLGVSPKTLASITRFHKFYRLFAANLSEALFWEDLYSHYHDQSHFIKEFKRYAGLPPQKFAGKNYELSRAFYSE